jgi:hypothetical protein
MAKGDISLDTSHINWLQGRNFLLSQVGSEFFDISTVGKNCISRFVQKGVKEQPSSII